MLILFVEIIVRTNRLWRHIDEWLGPWTLDLNIQGLQV